MATSLLQQWAHWPAREPDTERGLVDAAVRGDQRAFDALVRLHEEPLRRFLSLRVGPGAVDDVMQETLLAAWVALAKFHRRSRFKVWLYGIALHKCADHSRSRARRSREVGWNEVGDRPSDAHRRMDEAVLRETVAGLLDQLPESQREVLELYYYGDLTLAEIAGVLGRNLNTVKYQFYRAHVVVERGWQTSQQEGVRIRREDREARRC